MSQNTAFQPDPEFRAFAEALQAEFVLEAELGRGGMGVVFRARDVRLDRPVALKVLPPALASDADLRARFLREARTAAQLSHPNIVPVHSADERVGQAYFVMSLVEGETLGARLRARGALTPVETVRILREVAWALAYAHARGVIHRDVKPDNILIERGSGRAMVTDFGIARQQTAAALTSDGHVVGTAHFMSPEQAQSEAIDGRSDLYALGVLGFLLLSGRLPFEGDNAPAVLIAQVTRPAPALREVAPQVPAPLAAVIDRCLSKRPNDRFATGEALAEALAAALDASPMTDPGTSGPNASIPADAAAAVWRRAAQLQAEAAARLEREQRVNALEALDNQGINADQPEPSRVYRVRDVEAAAVEAGISQRFVALALSELPATGVALAPAKPTATRRVGEALLGAMADSLSVSHVVQAPAREVLQAIGRLFQQAPFRMVLKDRIGPHPLDGGILVFRLPQMDASGQVGFPFMWLVYGLGAKEMRVTLRPIPGRSPQTEVTVFADLRPGIGSNAWGYAAVVGASVAGGIGGGAVLGVKALALAGAALAAPIVGAAALVGGLAFFGSRGFYQWELRTARKEVDGLFEALDGAVRSRLLFDDYPPPPPPAAASDDLGLGLGPFLG